MEDEKFEAIINDWGGWILRDNSSIIGIELPNTRIDDELLEKVGRINSLEALILSGIDLNSTIMFEEMME